jgi:hypothetical protein
VRRQQDLHSELPALQQAAEECKAQMTELTREVRSHIFSLFWMRLLDRRSVA